MGSSRTVKVLRLHLANRATYIWIPLTVVAATALISLAMYGVLVLGLEEDRPLRMYGFGGLQFVPAYYCVTIGIQSMMYTFPFALAMSATRREYINGTLLLAAGFAVCLSSLYCLGAAIEDLTDGYGIGFHFFSLAGWFTRFALWQQFVFLIGLYLMLLMAGFAGTTVFKRGGPLRLVVVLTLWTMAVVGASAIVTWREWWWPIGRWVLALTPAAAGGWMLAAAAGLGAGAYWSMRKTVP
ncbi:MAG: hypothetical protein LBO20_02450 [Bifidobacteriaceae bacterium]|jgi:hypothetical protein|nr:hypothetical protein [Bifidobacteriaceae bacterium]